MRKILKEVGESIELLELFKSGHVILFARKLSAVLCNLWLRVLLFKLSDSSKYIEDQEGIRNTHHDSSDKAEV